MHEKIVEKTFWGHPYRAKSTETRLDGALRSMKTSGNYSNI